MAKNPDKRASQADLDEFGDHELAGAPSIAALIAALPEEQREAYRNERRARLAEIRAAEEKPMCTWREYFETNGPCLSGSHPTITEGRTRGAELQSGENGRHTHESTP